MATPSFPPPATPGRGLRLALTLTACLAALPATWASEAAASPTLQRIAATQRIVIAHREASIPLSYVVDGRPVGYSVDVCRSLVRAIERHLGLRELKVAYRPVTSGNRFEVIERGEADLECGSTTHTAERRQRVAFTISHFIASSRLLVRSDRPFERIEDLDGQTVASTTGTTNIVSVERAARLKALNLTVRPARDHAEALRWVEEGTVAAFAMDDVLLFGLRANAAQPEALKVIGKPITIEPYAVMFSRQDAALKAVVDAEMRRLIRSGELQQLYTRWFLSPIPPKGINLQMRMPHLLADSWRFPSDYVPD